jgi:hypothetical protein
VVEIKNWNMSEFRRVRNSPGMVAEFHAMGEKWVAELNAQLRSAQAKRKQPIEDGYIYWISHGTRARLHIMAKTARAQAHEAEHSAILKVMHVAGKSNVTNPNSRSVRAIKRSTDAQGNTIHTLDDL